DDNSEPTVHVEIVHEALIREWERFRTWVHEDEENLRLSTEIMKSAQDWVNTGNEPAYLLTETRLDRALVWLQTADATDLQREFINTSQQARREREASEREQQAYVYELEERNRQRLQQIIVALAIGVVIAIGFGIFGFYQANQADIARDQAEASERNTRSRALANEVLEAASIPNAPLALALAAEANSFDNAPPVAQSALAEVAYLGPRNVYYAEEILFPDTDDIDVTVLHTLFFGDPNRLLAVGNVDDRLIVFDVDTGEIRTEVTWIAMADTDDATSAIATAALSPDGEYLVAGGTLGQVLVWRVNDGELINQAQQSDGRVRAIAFSPTSDQFATANDDTVVNLWTLSTGEYIYSYGTNDVVGTDDDPVGHEGAVLAIAFSNDGTQLVSGGADNKAILWDVDTRNIVWESGDSDAFSWVRSVAFDATGTIIAAGTSRGNLLVWRVNSDNNERVIIDEAHQGAILTLNFAPLDFFGNSETLVSASTDGEITLWNAENMNINRRHSYSDYVGAVTSVIYRPNGGNLLSVGDDDRIIEWDTEQGAIENRFNTEVHTDVVWDVAYAPDNDTALTGSSDGTIIVWDLVNPQPAQFIETGYPDNTAVEYSPDGNIALVGTGAGDLLVYDTNTWDATAQLDGHIDTIRDLVFSPDGRTAMSISDDGTLIIWDIEQLTKVRQVTFFDDTLWEITGVENATYQLDGFDESGLGFNDLFLPTLWSIAYAPDGEHVLIGEDNGNVIWWNPFIAGEASVVFLENTNDEIPHNDTVRSVAISPDNSFALTASDDGIFLQWDLSDNDNPRLSATTYENAGRINDMAISSDGRFALTASENQAGTAYTVDMWDIASGERIRSLEGHTDWVSSVRYSTNGRFALSASADNTLIEWRIDTDRELFQWTLDNRAVSIMTCEQRAEWSAEDCEDDEPPYEFDELLDEFPDDEPMVVPNIELISGTATPTLIPTEAPTITPTPAPTSTPQPLSASIGRNEGSLIVGSADAWAFEVVNDAPLTFLVMADVPLFAPSDSPSDDAIVSAGGLDTVLQIFDAEGTLVAEHDDIGLGINSNSELVNISLEAGIYQIVVSSFNNSTAGDYTLEIIQGQSRDDDDDRDGDGRGRDNNDDDD
ncbi:MAG: WD40 repeat domain-containing protein, partial [Chloroflexota bacterium]